MITNGWLDLFNIIFEPRKGTRYSYFSKICIKIDINRLFECYFDLKKKLTN